MAQNESEQANPPRQQGGAGRIARLWESTKTASKIVPTVAIALVVGTYVFQRYRNPAIIVSPVVLPTHLAESGVSATELTVRLLDTIDSLREASRPTTSQSGWILETDLQYPELEVPGIKMSLPAFFNFLDGTFGHKAKKLSWAVSGRPKGTDSTDTWIVTASVTGARMHSEVFSLKNPDAALRRIAMAILEDAEPYVAISVLRFGGRCEDARSLAGRQLTRARTRQDRATANNMMGFVSECGFDDIGSNIDDAELFYRRAIQIDSTNPQPRANLARILAEQGDSSGSRREFDIAARYGPSIAATFEAWGYALMLAGDYRSAIPKLNQSISLDPSLVSGYLNLGYAHLNLGDTTAAIDALGAGVFRQPDAVTLKQYGHLLVKRRKWAGAADAFRRAAVLDTADREARYWLAVSLDTAGRHDAAQRVFVALARQSRDTDLYCAGTRKYLRDLRRCGL
jgi:Flp pilus assembly protein TadD